MRECIEEGVLQSYLDDELSPEMAEAVASHLAACQDCAAMADEAAGDTALLASAFAAENALEIPTVRLRERLDSAIAELEQPANVFEQKRGRGLGGWLAPIAELFKASPQRALGFASLIAIVAFAAIFASIKLRQSGNTGEQPQLVASGPQPTGRNVKPSPSPTPNRTDNPSGVPDREEKNNPNNRPKQKKHTGSELVPEPSQLPKDELAGAKPLPGEQNYLKAIDSLMTEIQASGETALKPSLRAEYERNLAIVDRAINSTRHAARRNPNDSDASEFLYSSYQSKLDLLSAIAEQVRPTVATR
ncbi:MAG TPA: anti-sigma factor [Pyrinomonadaceae bacterium]|nr:anti-sigma factor [Pyrinomonadaceae bacterium]